MKKAIVALLFAISVAVVAIADQPTVLAYYDAELFKINYQMFGGLQIAYQGQTSSAGFGISDSFKAALSRYPDSKELVDSYSGMNLAGNILVFGGLGIVTGGLVVALAEANSPTIDRNSALQTVLIIDGIGIVVELVGALLLPASFEKLTQSVNTYNRHKIEDYGK